MSRLFSPQRIAAALVALGILAAPAAAGEPELLPRRREFNVIITGIKIVSDTPSVRVALCMTDRDNCYGVDLAKDSVRIVRVEMGRSTPIGTAAAAGLTPGVAHDLIIKRRRVGITVALDGKVVARAYDDTYTRGPAGVQAAEADVTFDKPVKLYDCSEVFNFGDDFMTTKATSWAPTGNWTVLEAKNVELSANPFKYCGKGRPDAPAVAAANPPGSINWDDYSARVSVKDDAGARVGLGFYYVDAKNYHLLRWSGAKAEKPVVQIVRVRNAKEAVLAEAPGGYIPGQWYRLRVDVSGASIAAFIDDTPVASAEDDSLVRGSVALYSESPLGAVFDDVVVQGTAFGSFSDSFTADCPGKWMELGGMWAVGGGTMRGESDGPAKAVTGDPRWCNYVVSCDLRPPGAGAAGITFYYQDELNYLLYRAAAGGQRELIRCFDGVKKTLASFERSIPAQPEPTSVSIADGLVRLSIDAKQVAEVFDPSLAEGLVGLYVEGGAAAFGPVKVETPPQPEPVLSLTTDILKAEKSMEVFASDQRDWVPAERLDVNGRRWWWHRANLFGEMEVELNMSKEKADNTSFELALDAVTGPAGSGNPASGYTLTVWKTGSWQLAISRQGKELARAASVFKESIWHIQFSRKGSHLFGRLNRKLEIWVKDDEPLRGPRAGYALVPPPGKNLIANIYCPNLLTYTYSKSPVDWRSAAGQWEVMERWSCDDRWSWFGGEARNGPAIIWSKHTFRGDFSMEFCGAIRMDSTRGAEYNFARDMNVTIAADGYDLATGYSFIFGGWKNTVSCIARGNAIVAQPENMALFRFSRSSNMHRQWWYFKMERFGNKLRWYVDDRLAAEYTDAQPLTGDRIALWAYDVGISVARVRISAEEVGPFEPPILPGKPLQTTIYDAVPDPK